LFVSDKELHWIREDLTLKIVETMQVEATVKYRQALKNATLHKVETVLYVELINNQAAIQEGQFVAWYQEDELLGSGVIS
jgi:tRNA-specific 2-thiouridylase